MRSGVSYVTLCMATEDKPHVAVSLYPDDAARFQAKLLSSGTPLLNIEHGDAEVTVWPRNPEQISNDDLVNARRLVEAATEYLDLCERIHTESAM